MADRRMFSKTIIDSDAFLDMPLSAQCLYFHLSMRADDDGFVNNPKKIQRMIGASDDDFKLLIAKQFVLVFEGGIIVIKHWKMHNYIRSDRYKPTAYQKEKRMLTVTDNGSYDWQSDGSQPATKCLPVGIPNDNQMDTQDRLGKDSIGKVSIGKSRSSKVNNNNNVDEPDEYNPFGEAKKPPADTLEAYITHSLQRMSGDNLEELVSFKDVLGEELVRRAINKATGLGWSYSTFSYVKGILQNYINQDIRTLADAEAADAKFKQQKGGGKQTDTKQAYQQHEYKASDFGDDFYYDPMKDYGEA